MLHRVLFLLMCFCFAPVMAESIATRSGLSTQAFIYGESGKPITLVFIHGKGSEPDKPDYKALYSKLNGAGYRVIAPRMPWAVGANAPIPYNRKPLYDRVPVDAANVYLELPAGYVDMLGQVAELLVSGLDRLGSP